jgi:hypothetical protein
MAPAPPELLKKIEEDIRKSGFPLEVRVLNVCSTKNTGRMPNVKYEYLGELREIDLLTFFETQKLKSKRTTLQHTWTDLIIECKKSTSKPWVFFSTPSYAFENVAGFLKYASAFDSYFSKTGRPSLLAQIYPHIRTSYYADPAVPRCISYYEAFRGTSPSEIYRAIDSVITYLSHRRETREARHEEFGVFSEFYLPIVVLDGYLFEASVGLSEIEVQERSHLQLRTFHRGDIYIIDIVTVDHFQQFVDEIAGFHQELVSAIAKVRFPPHYRAAALAKVNEWVRTAQKMDAIVMAMEDAKRRTRAVRKSRPSTKHGEE